MLTMLDAHQWALQGVQNAWWMPWLLGVSLPVVSAMLMLTVASRDW